MAVHNQPSFEAVPGLVNMLKFFDVYDTAAEGFKNAVEQGDLQKAAEFQAVMFRSDCWLRNRGFEA